MLGNSSVPSPLTAAQGRVSGTELVMLLACIRKMLSSNLDLDADCPGGFRVFLSHYFSEDIQ
jgi:hypothetical protein